MENRLTPTLQNEKVILRPLQLSDEAELWPIAQEKALWIYGLKELNFSGELQKYIESALRDQAAETAIIWVIIDAKTGKVAGCTRLAEMSWKDERGQIG